MPNGSSAARRAGRETSIWTAVKPVTVGRRRIRQQSIVLSAQLARRGRPSPGRRAPVVGMIWMMPVSAVSFGVASGDLLDARDLLDRRPSARPGDPADRSRSTIVPVMISGPLKPRPNCSADHVEGDPVARRWPGCVRTLGRASDRFVAGKASVPRPTTTSTIGDQREGGDQLDPPGRGEASAARPCRTAFPRAGGLGLQARRPGEAEERRQQGEREQHLDGDGDGRRRHPSRSRNGMPGDATGRSGR